MQDAAEALVQVLQSDNSRLSADLVCVVCGLSGVIFQACVCLRFDERSDLMVLAAYKSFQ